MEVRLRQVDASGLLMIHARSFYFYLDDEKPHF